MSDGVFPGLSGPAVVVLKSADDDVPFISIYPFMFLTPFWKLVCEYICSFFCFACAAAQVKVKVKV